MEHIQELVGSTRQFAEACYAQNTIAELVEGLQDGAVDRYDCMVWEMNSNQWHIALKAVVLDLIQEVH